MTTLCGPFYLQTQAAYVSHLNHRISQVKAAETQLRTHPREKRDINGIKGFIRDVTEHLEVDIIFIMDRSTGVGQRNFYLEQLNMVRSLTTEFMYVSPDRVRLGVVTFGKDATVVFDHISKDYLIKCQLVESEDLWHQVLYYPESERAHGTNISGAFQLSAPIFQSGKDHRPSALQLIILVTDGELNRLETTKYEAQTLKRSGVFIYGVGVGNYLKEDTIKQLVSYDNYYGDESEWVQLLAEHGTHIASAHYIVGKCINN